jgi:hypothetical protein
LGDEERGHLGFFILAYLNPDVQPGAAPIGFSFDMSPRDIDKIFARFTQVYNAIYPQNIADSATTSFSPLLGRRQFFSVDGSVANGSGGKTYVARSNAFTRNNYKIVFVDRGISPKSPFNFSIDIYRLDNTFVGTIPFGKGLGEQGPSVNYLMDIVSSGDIARALETAVPNFNTIAKLDKLVVATPEMLFDLKRLGDHEQMLAAEYAFTGDKYAGEFRRLLRRPGGFQSTKGIQLWRFPTNMTPEELAAATAAAQARAALFARTRIIEALKVLLPHQPLYQAVPSDLLKMKAHVLLGIRTGTVFNDLFDLQPLVAAFDAGNTVRDFLATNHSRVASTLASLILRYRMVDIYRQIESIEAAVADLAGIENLPQVIAFLENTDPATNPEYQAVMDQATAIIRGKEALRGLNFTPNAKGRVEPIYVNLFTDAGRLIKGATSSIFNFSAGPYMHPETGLVAVIGRIFMLANSTRIDASKKRIEDLFAQYFKARDPIKDAFYDQDMLDSIEVATDVSSGLTPGQIAGQDLPGAGQSTLVTVIANVVRTVSPELAPFGVVIFPAPAVAADMAQDDDDEDGAMVGGAGNVLQVRDMHDLFVELCIDATTALETGQDHLQALDMIESKWVEGIDELRATSYEEYGLPFDETTTTDAISFLLSFRTGTDKDGVSQTIPGATFQNSPVLYPNFVNSTRAVRGVSTIFNDIAAVLMVKIPVEKSILEVLQLMYYITFEKNPTAYSAPAEWDMFVTQIFQYLSPGRKSKARAPGTRRDPKFMAAPRSRKIGGLRERRPLYSNARSTDDAVQPVHDEGLRERRRTRRAPRVRQSADKSRGGGQRDDVGEL